MEYKILSLTYKVLTTIQPSYLQQSLFIFGHTRSSIYIIFSTYIRSFLPVCFPSSLESTPGFRHPRTNLSNYHTANLLMALPQGRN